MYCIHSLLFLLVQHLKYNCLLEVMICIPLRIPAEYMPDDISKPWSKRQTLRIWPSFGFMYPKQVSLTNNHRVRHLAHINSWHRWLHRTQAAKWKQPKQSQPVWPGCVLPVLLRTIPSLPLRPSSRINDKWDTSKNLICKQKIQKVNSCE